MSAILTACANPPTSVLITLSSHKAFSSTLLPTAYWAERLCAWKAYWAERLCAWKACWAERLCEAYWAERLYVILFFINIYIFFSPKTLRVEGSLVVPRGMFVQGSEIRGLQRSHNAFVSQSVLIYALATHSVLITLSKRFIYALATYSVLITLSKRVLFTLLPPTAFS